MQLHPLDQRDARRSMRSSRFTGAAARLAESSAGLAIQGEIAYDACPDQSAASEDVLKDPYSVDVSLSRGFFDWPPLRHVITDTHFKKRDRMGRLLVFLARALNEGHDTRLVGFGVNEAAAAVMDARGRRRYSGMVP